MDIGGSGTQIINDWLEKKNNIIPQVENTKKDMMSLKSFKNMRERDGSHCSLSDRGQGIKVEPLWCLS